eukprot:m.33669 g.33669  ORF g.33669 m.33669 type:complete len:420 (-) comp9654_c0_seq1:3117-4376(-)
MKFQGEGDYPLLFAAFNQDNTRVGVGTADGFRIFGVTDDMSLISDYPGEGASIVEMMYETRLVAQVGFAPHSSERELRILNVRRKKELRRMTYKTPIRAAHLNRKRLVLVLDNTIYIYDMSTMNLVHVITATPPNPNGVCALASCHKPGFAPETDESVSGCHNLFAYPKSKTEGEVHIYDVLRMQIAGVIKAHTSPLAALAFNNAGTRLATASTKGTVIKVFSTPDCALLFELRRGYATYAQITSLCFDSTSALLAVSSTKATVHVFNLDPRHSEPSTPADPAVEDGPADGDAQAAADAPAEPQAEGWGSYLASFIPVPKSVTDVWTQSRSFAQAHLPEAMPNVCAITGSKDGPCLTVVTPNGNLYQYEIPEAGGECVQVASRSLLAPADDGAQEDEEGAADQVDMAGLQTDNGANITQ